MTHLCAVGGLHKVAHDSGDGEVIYHCPFCGSGQVIARSDRTIECEFCHVNFTVQVQPQYPSFPQTIDGQPVQVPGMPGQVGVDPSAAGMPPGADPNAPVDPDAVDADGEVPPFGAAGGEDDEGESGDNDDAEEQEEEEGNAPPWAKKSSYRTRTGQVLDEEDYVRHIAIQAADPGSRAGVLARVKASRS